MNIRAWSFRSRLKTLALFSGLLTAFSGKAADSTYKVASGSYEGFFLKKSATAPTVLLIHDWDGLTEYEKKRAKMLSDLGYSVVAADLFGKGVRPTEDKDKRQHTGELYKDRKRMRELIAGALRAAKEKGINTKDLVAAGYCFGGAAVLEMARAGIDAKGYVTFHGGLKTPEGQDYSQTKAKVVVFHGTADRAIPMTDLAQLGTELEKNKVDHELISYGGAPHAFTVFGSPRYRKTADEKSWSRFTTFLSDTLRK